jgi:hypothetical protein
MTSNVAPVVLIAGDVAVADPDADADVWATRTGPLGTGVTVRTAVLTPLYVAVIVTAVFVATVAVVIVNDGDTVVPAATSTVDGTVVLESLLLSVTNAPPVGAGAVRVTVLAVVDPPPTTEVDDRFTAETAGADTVSGRVTLAVVLLASVTVNCGL